AQARGDVGALGLELGRLLEVLERLFDVVLLLERDAEGELGRRVVAAQLDGLAELADGPVEVPLLLEGQPLAIVDVGLVGEGGSRRGTKKAGRVGRAGSMVRTSSPGKPAEAGRWWRRAAPRQPGPSRRPPRPARRPPAAARRLAARRRPSDGGPRRAAAAQA